MKKFDVEICDIDAFASGAWSKIDEISDPAMIPEMLKYPCVDPYDGMMVRVSQKYLSVCIDGRFREFSRDIRGDCAWTIDNNCKYFKKGKSWLDAWVQCHVGTWLASVIQWPMTPVERVRLCLSVIDEFIAISNFVPSNEVQAAYDALKEYVRSNGTADVKTWVVPYRYGPIEYEISRSISVTTQIINSQYYMSHVAGAFGTGRQFNVAFFIRKAIPLREVIKLIFK